MDSKNLSTYWNDIPIGKENAVGYNKLIELWKCTERTARLLLHELSDYDNGDNYILIRSSRNKGFYKTDNEDDIKAYKKECINKGRSIFAPVKKINRVLNSTGRQYSFDNNMRVIREGLNMRQSDVCKQMRKYDRSFDKSLLSKMENSICLPTLYQLSKIAEIYGVEPLELINVNLYY